MVRIYLTAYSSDYARGVWELQIGNFRTRLVNPHRDVVSEFSTEDVEQKITLPDDWRLRRTLGVEGKFGTVIRFLSDKEAIKKIKSYLDDRLAAQGKPAIAFVAGMGWFRLVVVLVALVATALFVMYAARDIVSFFAFWPFIMTVLLVIRPIFIVDGIRDIARAGRAKRARRRQEQDSRANAIT